MHACFVSLETLGPSPLPPLPLLAGYSDPCRLLTRVVAKGVDWIKVERPVPYNIALAWKPEIHKFMPMLNDATGVEGLTMQFPPTVDPGHFLEQGYNGIHFNQVRAGQEIIKEPEHGLLTLCGR